MSAQQTIGAALMAAVLVMFAAGRTWESLADRVTRAEDGGFYGDHLADRATVARRVFIATIVVVVVLFIALGVVS